MNPTDDSNANNVTLIESLNGQQRIEQLHGLIQQQWPDRALEYIFAIWRWLLQVSKHHR